ncbi:MAG TPA: hypothetical protein VH391_07445 [Solirubrobacterales bacterium]|jgi:hypothetical protein
MSEENVEAFTELQPDEISKIRGLEHRIFAIGRIRPRGTTAHGAR